MQGIMYLSKEFVTSENLDRVRLESDSRAYNEEMGEIFLRHKKTEKDQVKECRRWELSTQN